MSPAEYSELSQAKERAADLHRLRKLHFRERIADAIQANPEWAYTIAQETLNKETAVWQQWSRAAWKTLLASKNPKEMIIKSAILGVAISSLSFLSASSMSLSIGPSIIFFHCLLFFISLLIKNLFYDKI